jgi:hypothetical protein
MPSDQESSEPTAGIERFANAYTRVVALFLAALTVAIGVAMVVMGNILARAIGVALLTLGLAWGIRTTRRP